MSVRGERVERVVYRERDVERERDSDRGTHYEAPRRTYTTVKRYQVPESTRSIFNGEDRVEEDKQIVIRRERREPSPPREEVQYRVTERVREREREPAREEVDYRFTERIREREPLSPQRRDISYRVLERDSDHGRSSAPRSEFRVVERERETVRAPSPPQVERVQEFRFERERDFSPPRRHEHREQDYDIEKYTKNTEYYAQPQPIIIREAAPQPIIIREERREPIVIREERREPHYEFIEREEVRDETRSLVRREEPPPPAPSIHAPPSTHRTPSTHTEKPEEENYFYERRVIERDRAPRRRDDSYDDRRSEVRPRDSASQYSSDDSYEYVRRERIREDSRSRSRSGSPHHRRHLAEGAIAGIGAAEILRHHKKSQGESVGGRAKSAVAGAAVGAIGAEAVGRLRNYSRRRRSRSRSRSSSYDDRRDRRDRRKKRSRSRSKSLSKAQQLGALAAVTAVGALAGYALKNKGNKETVVIKDEAPRRSRSRRRRASADSYNTDNTVLSAGGGRALDPEHRNRRMAQAGLASAAAAGIWDRVRSKSRGGRNRSQSRVKQGVPIVASGLGGAALAGLYEKHKATKEAKKAAIIEDEVGRGRRPSRRRSRSRSRSVPAPYPADDRYVDDRGMIAYGNEPIYPEQAGRGYYSDEEPGMYRRRHHGGSSSGSSPDTRRRRGSRSRSRGPGIAGVGAAAGAAAIAAHEIGKRRERSRQREESDRRRRDDEPYQYGHDQYPLDSPTPQGGGYLPQQDAYGNAQPYPSSTYFPPPPTADYARNEPAHAEQAPYPQYNPADYAAGGHQQPYHQSYGAYDESDANLGAPHPNDTFAGDPRYAATPDIAPHEERNRGRNPENVSAPSQVAAEQEHADGVDRPKLARERSQSRVRFNLAANESISPEESRKGNDEPTDESGSNGDHQHRRRGRRGGDGHRDSPGLMHDKYEHGSDSEGTVELPERFDEHGNRKADDPLADGITKLLGGAGLADLLGRLGGGGAEEDSGRSGRRRHRH